MFTYQINNQWHIMYLLFEGAHFSDDYKFSQFKAIE